MSKDALIYVGGALALIYAWYAGYFDVWAAALENLAAGLSTLTIVAATLGGLWYMGAPKLTGSGLV